MATQSNDFALGLPIATSLYGKTNPTYFFLVYVRARVPSEPAQP
jgi:hypothetical protein